MGLYTVCETCRRFDEWLVWGRRGSTLEQIRREYQQHLKTHGGLYWLAPWWAEVTGVKDICNN